MKLHDWARREGAEPAPVRLALPAPEAKEQNDSASDTANSDDDAQGDAARARAAADRRLSRAARNASLDPGDGIDL